MYAAAHDLQSLSGIIGEENLAEMQRRFEPYLNLTKTFLVEDCYIDREWREEFSSFYAFTFYDNVGPFTKRIHLIERTISGIGDVDSIQPNEYLGYVVLRPAPTPNRILKAILAPRKEALGVEPDASLYVALCTFKPHIGGKEFNIETFPFYAQDAMVTVCAHASMFMNGLYMHRQHGMNRPFFRDFARYTSAYPGRVLPSQGLTPVQMATILASLGYNPVLEAFETDKDDELAECLNKINSYLESALPPLLIYGPHVVSVVGHTLKNGVRDYVIFDDSGYHLSSLVGFGHFAYRVPMNNLVDALKSSKVAFLISFEFERQYFPLKSVEALFSSTLNGETSRRILIVDSKDFKKQTRLNNVMAFEDVSLPHYLWLVEFYSKDKLFCEILVDASAHKDDDRSVLAVWIEKRIKFYKPTERVIDVKSFPVSFSNLRRVN